MFIRVVKIEPKTMIKVYGKHSVLSDEIAKVLRADKTAFKKTGGDQYAAIGLADRYLTVFFRYDAATKEAAVTTAYLSSAKQIRSYKHLMR